MVVLIRYGLVRSRVCFSRHSDERSITARKLNQLHKGRGQEKKERRTEHLAILRDLLACLDDQKKRPAVLRCQ